MLGQKGSSRQEENLAFYGNIGGSKRRKLEGGSKKNVEYYNCKKHRYYKAECWAKDSRKAGQGPSGSTKPKGKDKEGSSNRGDKDKGKDTTASTKDNGNKEGWTAITVSDDEYDAISKGKLTNSLASTFTLSDDDIFKLLSTYSEYNAIFEATVRARLFY